MPKRLAVALRPKHAMQVTRVSVGEKKLVYVIVAQRPLKYPWGASRIAYIGTTKKGLARVARSAAVRADDVLALHGVREFYVRILTCAPRPNVKTWVKLERALVLVFRQKYGALPRCNTMGEKMRARDEFDYFKRDRIENVLEALQ